MGGSGEACGREGGSGASASPRGVGRLHLVAAVVVGVVIGALPAPLHGGRRGGRRGGGRVGGGVWSGGGVGGERVHGRGGCGHGRATFFVNDVKAVVRK